jgi:hypothetical protein
MAAIIVTGQVDNEVFALTRTEAIGLVTDGGTFANQLEAEISRLLLGSPSAEPPKRVDLDIWLSTESQCTYQFQAAGQPAEPARPLTVQASKLKRLVQQSSAVAAHFGDDSWKSDIRTVGDTLAGELFQPTPANLEFRDSFNRWIGRVGIANMRVRFTVQDILHPILVEAFKQNEDDDDYWMLKTAVYRGQQLRRDAPMELRGLFQDEAKRAQPANFLIIQAEVPNQCMVREAGLELLLDPLPRVKDEVAQVAALLAQFKAKGQLIGEVRVIRNEDVPAGGSFKQLVEAVLQERKWQVIHYAGHTHYDSIDNVGYLFFPCGSSELEPVKADLFAYFLRQADTRFVFLCSCEGGQQDFIYQLAKERVPAIMGFLWNVGDTKAGVYARSFYTHLLGGEQRSLEYACLEAKKEMHARYVDDPIWACAVLVMQVGV